MLPLDGLVPTAPKPKDNDASADDKKASRRGKHPGRSAPPSLLPRVPVFNRVPPELRVCPQCGSMMTTVSHSSCLILNVIPARVFVEERLDETIACPNDDTIVSASPPPQIVERGKLADALMVEVGDKYIEHMPIERQCARCARSGVDVAPQTLGRGVSAAVDLLAPVARLITSRRGPGLLGTDATGIPVLDPDAPGGIRHGTVWAWTNARWVSFFCSSTRPRATPSASFRDARFTSLAFLREDQTCDEILPAPLDVGEPKPKDLSSRPSARSNEMSKPNEDVGLAPK